MNDTIEQLLHTVLRMEPKQGRSSARIELLLDTAAATIDAKGIEGLTTSDVAELSGSSVGVVYRYFPNIRSLLQSLALRNMKRYLTHLDEGLSQSTGTWADSVDVGIDQFVWMMRNEPGFRALRFGDLIEGRLLNPDVRSGGMLSQLFGAMMHSRYGLEKTPELIFSLEVSVEVSEALLKRAFLLDAHGDERFIRKAHDLANAEFTALLSNS